LAIKEYKDEVALLNEKIDKYAKVVGKITLERFRYYLAAVIDWYSKAVLSWNISNIKRFWRSAKCERIYLNEYNSIKQLKDDVKDYMEFYNHRRFHETLEYQKPMAVYQNSLAVNDRTDTDSDKRVG